MLTRIKQELIIDNEDYLILKNGNIIEKSRQELGLDFSLDCSLKIIHLLDQETTIKYQIRKDRNVKIIEIFYNFESTPQLNIELIVEENGKCDFLSLRKTLPNSDIKANVNSRLARGAYLNYKTLSISASNLNCFEDFYLEAEDINLKIKNVLINSAGKTQKYNFNIHHNAKATQSTLMNYAICRNNSFLEVNSKGLIKQGAHKAAIQQRTKGLLLDQNSDLSANPLLEIDDYDVIANHGASIGAIDENELYYLMSRGLTREEAERLIVNGFINPVMEEIREEKLKQYVLTWVNQNI